MGQYRQQVLNAARELITGKGLFEFSMRDLAKATGLSVGALYREINNKNDLLLLIAIDNIRLHDLSFNQIKPLKLNHAEQLMYLIGFAPYCTDLIDYDTSSDAFTCDSELTNRATPEVMQELRDYLQQHLQQLKGLVDYSFDKRAFTNSKDRAMEVTVDLMILCRGTRVKRLIQTNLIFRPNSVTTKKLCKLGELVLRQLDWNIEGQLLDPKKLDMAWKTAMDQSAMASSSIPLYKKVDR